MWGEASNNGLFKQVLIIGNGLIGSSLGLALKEFSLAGEIYGYDLKRSNMEKARELGALDKILSNINKVPPGTDLIVFATPVAATLELLPYIANSIPPGCLVTDTGSTKEAVMDCFELSLPSAAVYVGGHPMAGSEAKGPEAARADLFTNAAYILVEGEKPAQYEMEKLEKMLIRIKAKPVRLSPQDHDKIVALISHLPHMAAVTLTETVRKHGELAHLENIISLAAGGFYDTTRVAMSNPEMWRDICVTNVKNMKHTLLSFKEEVDNFLTILESLEKLEGNSGLEEKELLLSYLQKVQAFRAQIPDKRKIIPGREEI